MTIVAKARNANANEKKFERIGIGPAISH
jgi:hypothetical protein